MATRVRRRRRWGGLLAAGAALAGTVAGAPAATAQSACSGQFLNSGRVQITQPTPGATVSGTVRVSGTASAVVPLSRVELFANGIYVTGGAYQPSRQLPFSLYWNAARAAPGPVRLRVVACGGAVLGTITDGGQAEVGVTVTTPPTTTTTGVGSPGGEASTTTSTSLRDTTSTTLAGQQPAAPGASVGGVSTTRPGPRPGSERSVAELAARAQPESGEGAGGGGPGLLLTPADDKRPGPPLWVGVVVGLPAIAGLALSAVRRRQRAVGPNGPGLAELS